MAGKISNETTQKQATVTAPDWGSGRSRWHPRELKIRRGYDREWHFSGQQPGEVVRRVSREHPIFILPSALPLIGSIIGLGLAFYAGGRLPDLGVFWQLLEGTLAFLVLLTAGWFIYKDLVRWWFDTYIVTNKRLIISKGLLGPRRDEVPLEKITQIALDRDTFLGFLLSYGTVHLYLVGKDLPLKRIARPRAFKDSVLGILEESKNKKPAPEPEAPQKEEDLSSLLSSLAKGKPVPTLEDVDAKYPKRNPDQMNGPRRTFGGPLKISCNVRYSSGEFTVAYIQRSRYVLYRNLLGPLLGVLALTTIFFLVPSFWLVAGLGILCLLVLAFLIYVNYVDDVYILTNKRIIDIDRHIAILFEQRIEATYSSIKDIRVAVPNLFQRILDVGNVVVETPGENPNIVFKNVDHPFVVQDKIFGIKSYKDRVDAAKKANEPLAEIHKWFSKVVPILEKKIQHDGAPNLRLMDLWTAIDRASEFGMRVVVAGEDLADSDVQPGLVVRQNPPPGTLMVQGAEIQVILSKRTDTGPLFGDPGF